MKLSWSTIHWILVGMAVFFLSLYISPYYVEGDQFKYANAYKGLTDYGLLEGYDFYVNEIGGTEFFYYFIIWIASNCGFEKYIVMAVANAILAISAMKLFAGWKVAMPVSALILLSNFYFMVLYFAAERLKFAVLFFVISLLYIGSKKRFYLSAAMAIASHFQIFMLYASMLSLRLGKALWSFLKVARIPLSRMVLGTVALVVFAVLAQPIVVEYIIPKANYYARLSSGNELADMARIMALLALSLWYSKSKSETVLIFIPLILASMILGGDRVNIFGYFAFLYYGLRYNRGINIGILITSLYFVWKSYYFVLSTLEYGYGYALD